VPENDNVETRCSRVEVKLREIVQDIDQDIVDAKYLGLRNRIGPRTFVIVSSHDRDRSQSPELLEHLGIPNIAGVNNTVAAAKKPDCLWPQETVGVRNKANTWHRGTRVGLTPLISDALMPFATSQFVHTALAACACYATVMS